jgi:hypothetical protein
MRHRTGPTASANLLRIAGILLPGLLTGPTEAGQSRALLPISATVMAVAHIERSSTATAPRVSSSR